MRNGGRRGRTGRGRQRGRRVVRAGGGGVGDGDGEGFGGGGRHAWPLSLSVCGEAETRGGFESEARRKEMRWDGGVYRVGSRAPPLK